MFLHNGTVFQLEVKYALYNMIDFDYHKSELPKLFLN